MGRLGQHGTTQLESMDANMGGCPGLPRGSGEKPVPLVWQGLAPACQNHQLPRSSHGEQELGPTTAFSRTETQAPVDSRGPAHIFTWNGRIKLQIGVFLSSKGVAKGKKQNPVSCLQVFKTLKLRSSVSQYMETKSWPNFAVGWFIFAPLSSSSQGPFPNVKHLSSFD